MTITNISAKASVTPSDALLEVIIRLQSHLNNKRFVDGEFSPAKHGLALSLVTFPHREGCEEQIHDGNYSRTDTRTT